MPCSFVRVDIIVPLQAPCGLQIYMKPVYTLILGNNHTQQQESIPVNTQHINHRNNKLRIPINLGGFHSNAREFQSLLASKKYNNNIQILHVCIMSQN